MVVFVDDAVVGMQAGRYAGAWTIAVSKSGNALGLSEAEVQRMPAEEIDRRLEPARRSYLAAGAHLVIDTVADLLPALEEIEKRMNGLRASGFSDYSTSKISKTVRYP